jgi:phosphoglycolate phosphatase
MHYDAVLFDLDGTLTDSGPGIFHSIRYAIEKLGLEDLEEPVLRQFVGPPLRDSFMKFFHMDSDRAEEAIAVYREDFATQGLFINRVYTGLPNLLRRLKAQGVYVALATSKPSVFARRILEHFGLLGLFDTVIGVPLEARDADKADIIRAALPARFHRAVMVGDRHYDVAGAKANHIDAIGVLYGYGSRAELMEAGADVIVEDVAALYQLLCGSAPQPQGLFVTIEGLDGSGKTTQLTLLAEHLYQAGWDVLCTHEPGGCPLADKMRALLLDVGSHGLTAEAEALLFAAARAQHVRETIAPALARGQVVLSDRFVDSSVAYQGGGRGLGVAPVQRINEMALGACVPDVTILFMVDAQTALLRRGSATKLDRMERAGEAFFQRVYDTFVSIARAEPDRVHCVDASQSVPEVTEAVFTIADQAVRAHLAGQGPRT